MTSIPTQRTPAEFLADVLSAPRTLSARRATVETPNQKGESMTTTTIPITITCPDWCEVPADEHVGQLWDMEGNCIHHSHVVEVPDTVGFHRSLEAPNFARPVEVSLTSETDHEGRETAPPMFHLLGHELTVSQALALAKATQEQVYTYRAAGGVA